MRFIATEDSLEGGEAVRLLDAGDFIFAPYPKRPVM
jgi:hypothetical protein